MNSKHKNISFSYETEKDGAMPFLDVNIFREKGKFVTNVYRKETFTGVYTNFSSFIPLEYKFGLAYTFLHRCFNLVSNMSKFHLEVAKLKKILLKNGCPRKIIDTFVFKFLNNAFEPKRVTLTVPKKQLFIVLPFMGNLSGVIKKHSKNAYLFVNYGLFLNPPITLKVTLTLKVSYQNLYDHAKYTNLRAEAATLPILAKPFGI